MQDIVEGFLEGAVLLDTQAPKPVRSYHVRPTNRIGLVVRGEEGFWLTSANWQIAPKGGRPLINARIENDRFWRQAWAHGRCMIPALGYFEWTQLGGRKEPVFITVKRNVPVLFFAGFLSEDQQGCVILTRPPSKQIAHIHSRMPIILAQAEINDWLNGKMDVATAQASLGTHWEGWFEFHRVAPLTQDADGAAVIEPYAPPQASFEF